jgi:hypothetical protein
MNDKSTYIIKDNNLTYSIDTHNTTFGLLKLESLQHPFLLFILSLKEVGPRRRRKRRRR